MFYQSILYTTKVFLTISRSLSDMFFTSIDLPFEFENNKIILKYIESIDVEPNENFRPYPPKPATINGMVSLWAHYTLLKIKGCTIITSSTMFLVFLMSTK